MAEQRFAPKYRNNITHTRIMSLWGRNEEKTVASFNLYVTGNVLHLNVYTGLSEDKQRKQKSIKFDFKDGQITSFLAILEGLVMLSQLPHEGEAKTIVSSIFGYVKFKDMDKAERREIGKILVGRDKNGIYFISAINNTHGRVKFNFELDRDIVIYDINSNEPIEPKEASERMMLQFVNNAKLILANVLTQEYVDKDAEKEDGKENKASGYRASNSSGNSNNSTPNDIGSDFDDLLP
jgi:hypothetical protein|nr:MAG TPA: hypothetical protein [Caudoviricetes sp.]DAX86780.1 MAG TPA: hypothetical protein [Caudoviricetes sp.]